MMGKQRDRYHDNVTVFPANCIDYRFVLTEMKTDYPLFIDINVCKNDSCRNVALPGSPDYESPTYHLGFAALYCHACGGNNHLLNNEDINKLLLPKLTGFDEIILNCCPRCYGLNKKRYGKTTRGTLRWQCRCCRHVFSYKRPYINQIDRLKQLADLLFFYDDFKTVIQRLEISDSTFYRLLEQLSLLLMKITRQLERKTFNENDLHVATQTFTLACKNGKPATKAAKLWGIMSAHAASGYLLLTTVNYSNTEVSRESVYTPSSPPEPVSQGGRLVDQIAQRYKSFTQRAYFDELVYTSTPVSSKKGNILTPVITAQLHFHELKHYFSCPSYYHYLEHEVMVRGACITAFGRSIPDGKCHMFYLVESKNATPQTRFYLQTSYQIGWWKNVWYQFYSPANPGYKLLGLLTSKDKLEEKELNQLPATFHESESFMRYFNALFPEKRLQALSPEIIQLILSVYRAYYNYCYVNSANKTPAQKAKIVNKRYKLSELIDLGEKYLSISE